MRRILITTAAIAALLAGAACGPPPSSGARGNPRITAAELNGTLAISDALEQLIDEGKDTTSDRAYAWEAARRIRPDHTAADAFARAAIAGRLVQARGLAVAGLVAVVERFARRSLELDPKFRDGAATRMLGTLYVLAPGPLLEEGDSEDGLALLEGLAAARPQIPENHLRLAEALLALGERGQALMPLCRALAARASLRPDDQRLLDKLKQDAGQVACPQTLFPASVAPR